MTEVKCLNKNCLYHKSEEQCDKKSIFLGTQGVCKI